MSGNAAEWCWDWYAENNYDSSPSENPVGPDTGDTRVLRGGSWRFGPTELLLPFRGYHLPKESINDVGFRLARSR